MELVIAEKPDMARHIAAAIGATQKGGAEGREWLEGGGWCVSWCFGHVVEATVPEAAGGWSMGRLPIIPSRMTLRPLKEKGYAQRLNVLKKLMERCDGIVVATDAGREGELIFRNLYEYMQCDKPFRRLWINNLSVKAIRDGFAHLYDGHDFDNLAEAARQRERADWVIGVNATRALTLCAHATDAGTVLSLGRVQTPTLAMICRRYIEHVNFKSEPFWFIAGETSADGQPFRFRGTQRYDRKEDAEKDYVAVVKDGWLKVEDITTKRVTDDAPLMHDLASLQKYANARYGLPMERTQGILQKLYEMRLVSYPRTSSRYIPEAVFETVPELLEAHADNQDFGRYARELLQAASHGELNRRSVSETKITDHHALIITEEKPQGLSQDEERIYNAVFSRFMEALMSPAVADVTRVTMKCAGVEFESRGRRDVSLGWRAVERRGEWEDVERGAIDSTPLESGPLPELEKGQKLPVDLSAINEDKTKPKPLYTDATLITAMQRAGNESGDKDVARILKDIGIGTAATRKEVFETLLRRKYIVREAKSIRPTGLGLQVYGAMKDSSLSDVRMTAQWEEGLEDIVEGRRDSGEFAAAINRAAEKIVAEIRGTKLTKLEEFLAEDALKCPVCGKPLRIGDKSAWCRECNYTLWRNVAGHTLTIEEMHALLGEQHQTGVIHGFKNKEGKAFDAFLTLEAGGTLSFGFEKKESARCFRCGNSVNLAVRGAFCDCGLKVWRTVGGKTLSDKTLRTLVEEGKTSRIAGFTSRNGKKFTARLVVDKEGAVGYDFTLGGRDDN